MSKMKKINKNGYFLSFTRSCIDRIAILLKQTNWVYKNKGIDIISSKIWDGEEEEEALGMEKKKKSKSVLQGRKIWNVVIIGDKAGPSSGRYLYKSRNQKVG